MKKLKVGHIGWLFRDDGPDCETVAWCDINEAKMRRAGEANPDITMYADYREMLKHPGLDLVVISTPNFVHAEQAVAFLDAGKHVFLEKPMGINREECDRVLAAAKRSTGKLAVDFEMRVSPYAERIRAFLEAGDYGALRRIEMIHHRGAWLEEGNGIWRTQPEKSGGMFLMEPIHGLDIMRSFAGEIESVQCISGPNVLRQYERIPDNLCCHLQFDSGVSAIMLSSHTLSAGTLPPERHTPPFGHDMNMIFTCERGSVQVDFINRRILFNPIREYPRGSGGDRVEHERIEDYTAADQNFFHDINKMRHEFIRRCAEGLEPVQSPEDAWRTHIVCLAAEASAMGGAQRITPDYTQA